MLNVFTADQRKKATNILRQIEWPPLPIPDAVTNQNNDPKIHPDYLLLCQIEMELIGAAVKQKEPLTRRTESLATQFLSLETLIKKYNSPCSVNDFIVAVNNTSQLVTMESNGHTPPRHRAG